MLPANRTPSVARNCTSWSAVISRGALLPSHTRPESRGRAPRLPLWTPEPTISPPPALCAHVRSKRVSCRLVPTSVPSSRCHAAAPTFSPLLFDHDPGIVSFRAKRTRKSLNPSNSSSFAAPSGHQHAATWARAVSAMPTGTPPQNPRALLRENFFGNGSRETCHELSSIPVIFDATCDSSLSLDRLATSVVPALLDVSNRLRIDMVLS